MNDLGNAYLERKSRSWYFNKRLSEDQRALYNAKSIRRTLSTHSLPVARQRRDILLTELEKQKPIIDLLETWKAGEVPVRKRRSSRSDRRLAAKKQSRLEGRCQESLKSIDRAAFLLERMANRLAALSPLLRTEETRPEFNISVPLKITADAVGPEAENGYRKAS